MNLHIFTEIFSRGLKHSHVTYLYPETHVSLKSMTTECNDCKGAGTIMLTEKECPDCEGPGKPKSISLDRLSEKDLGALIGGGLKCAKCSGTGKVSVTEPCRACGGRGKFFTCAACGSEIPGKGGLCEDLRQKNPYTSFSPECDTRELESGKICEGKSRVMLVLVFSLTLIQRFGD